MPDQDSPVVTLIGGGWTADVRPAVYGPFLAAAQAAAGGRDPSVALLVVDEGDGAEQAARWDAALQATAPCRPTPVLVPIGTVLDPATLADADALLVCGGLTPAYADALAPVAEQLRAWLGQGRPYAGFSAGTAVAAARALVGGYRIDGRPVCPEDAGEDLEEVTAVPGLGLVPVALDVHAAQWGTVGRAVAAVRAGRVPAALAVDEDTALLVGAGGGARVAGAGAVHVVSPAGDAVTVTALTAGDGLDLAAVAAGQSPIGPR